MLRRFMNLDLSTRIAIAFLGVAAAALAILPFMPGYNPTQTNLSNSRLGLMERSNSGTLHVLGTDQLGRDTLSQLVLGGRYSLLIAFGAVAISLVIGPLLGVLAAYFGGILDRVVVALGDLLLAVPRILLIIAVVAVVGRSVLLTVILLGVTGWVVYARVVRSIALSLKNQDFVSAAVGMGAGPWWIVRRHILPNTLAQVVVLASLDIGTLVIIESSLSYLGLGVQEPATSWGLMVSQGQEVMQSEPRLLIVPALTLSLVVLAINFAARALTSETRQVKEGIKLRVVQ